MKTRFPVIDIFAGPGGLGEGFSSLKEYEINPTFKVVLSIEKEYFAHQTLKLRAFFREFSTDDVPVEYYQCLRGDISTEKLLELFPDQAQAADNIAWHAELGNENHDEVDRRISKALNGAKNWVLIGGPPCQAYSIAGRSRNSKIWNDNPEEKENDSRHFLYREYLRILEKHNPPLFVMENVKGMLSSSVAEGKISELIFRDLDSLNYSLFSCVSDNFQGKDFFGDPKFNSKEFIIYSEKHGIPQKRHRVIIFGVRKDLDVSIPTLGDPLEEINVMDSISDLPKLRSGLSKNKDSNIEWFNTLSNIRSTGILEDQSIDKTIRNAIRDTINKHMLNLHRGSEYVLQENQKPPIAHPNWFFDERLQGVCNHSTRGHIPGDLYRYLFASCFAKEKKRTPKLTDFPVYLLPDHQNIDKENIDNTVFLDRFRVQLAEEPSTTITSHISKDGHYYIHPDPEQCRSLTVREAARLQTFPDNYYFLGPRTAQYVQVGNAVPPFLAQQIAQMVRAVLCQIE